MSRAEEIIKRGDVGEIVAMVLGARAAADEGRYCECAEPELAGLDLLCGECLLENREQIVKRTLHICNAHDFEPAERAPRPSTAASVPFMCERCAGWEDDPRHHGIDKQPRYPWGPHPEGT